MNILLQLINNGQPTYQQDNDKCWASFEKCINPVVIEAWAKSTCLDKSIRQEHVEQVRKALYDCDTNLLSTQLIEWLWADENKFHKDLVIDTFCDNLMYD
jgi:ABC-type transporter MlaC component